MKGFLKNYGFYVFLVMLAFLSIFNSCVVAEEESVVVEEVTININTHNILLQKAIDSAQNVIRDSIKKENTKISFWSSYELGLPTGTVQGMHIFSGKDYKLESRQSTEQEYGLITIKKEDGKLTTAVVTHDQYISLNPQDIIK